MNVLLTVDTEFHPLDGHWSADKLQEIVERDIDGITPQGEFGIFFQLQMLNEFRLKAVFFVEALSAYVAGTNTLKRIVDRILSAGHEIGLHLHPEWLRRAPSAFSGECKQGNFMHSFSEDEQTWLIMKGLEQLYGCGVTEVRSFRAGSYGADLATLRALARNGIAVDSSHNLSWSGVCKLATAELLLQPTQICDVWEFPVSCFQDRRAHWRHAQLCACSWLEMEFALNNARTSGWHSFVIVSHSFELLRGRRANNITPCVPDRTVIKRFRQLCQFLDANRDKFQTTTFSDIDLQVLSSHKTVQPIVGSPVNTMGRYFEQALRRMW